MSQQANSAAPSLNPPDSVGIGVRDYSLIKCKPVQMEEKGYVYVTFEIYGTNDLGQRVRLYRKNEYDAKALCLRLNAEISSRQHQEAVQITWFSREQIVDAERAKRMVPANVTFVEMALFWNAHNASNPSLISLSVAVATYLTPPELVRWGVKPESTGKQYAYVLRHFRARIGDSTAINMITSAQIREYLDQPKIAVISTNTRHRDALASFFAYAVDKKWISINPVSAIPKPRKSARKTLEAQSEPRVLSLQEAQRVMLVIEEFKGGILVPYFVLSMFCGIRPSLNCELGKLALDRELTGFLDKALKQIFIPARIAKNKKARYVHLEPVVGTWLRAYPLPILPTNSDSLIQEARRLAGISGREFHDTLRHTFCSMHSSAFRKPGDTALQAGHSEGVQRSRYMRQQPQDEALAFWQILPKRAVPTGLLDVALLAAVPRKIRPKA